MFLSPKKSLENALQDSLYVNLSDLSNVVVDLRYGTTNNILKRAVYDGFNQALLHKDAAQKFITATELLKKQKPDLKFIIFDALRPRLAQWDFWRLVENTPQQCYFADPKIGSLHNYGFAIDLGLLDKCGQELDMGTGFDNLSDLAQPKCEEKFLLENKLSEVQVFNRKILRNIMQKAGFEQLPHEWWHYDALSGDLVRQRYPILE